MPHLITEEQKKELQQILAAVSQPTRKRYISFDAHANEQGYVPVIDLIKYLSDLSPNLSALDLSSKHLNKFTSADLIKISNALPKELAVLNLANNQLGSLPAANLVKFFKSLPVKLTHIGLSANELFKLSNSDLILVLKALPPDITAIELQFNNLQSCNAQNLTKIIRALPRIIISINISNNKFSNFTANDLVCVTYALSRDLEELDLSDNLDLASPTTLIRLADALPKKLLKLHLNSNDMGIFPLEDFKTFLGTLPGTLTTLSLRNSNLQKFLPSELIQILYALPKNLVELDMSDNKFNLSVDLWLKVFRVLPEKLETLHMSWNNLEHLSPEDLFKVLNGFPAHIQTLSLDDKTISIADFQTKLLSKKIDEEIDRLDKTRNTILSIMGISNRPQGEIIAFKKLKSLINTRQCEHFKENFQTWHKEHAPIFKGLKKSTHHFFATNPEARSEQLLNSIYEFLGVFPEHQYTARSKLV